MECDDAKLRVQALVDNELDEQEISDVIDHVQSCYRCRDDYVELLKLQRKMKGIRHPEPPPEWFDGLQKRVGRRLTSLLGQVLFIGSYIVLIAYAIFAAFSDKSEGLFIKMVIGAIVAGVLFLLGVTIADRVRESKTDKYKGVMK